MLRERMLVTAFTIPLVLAGLAFADAPVTTFWIEEQNFFSEDKTDPRIWALLSGNYTSTIGVFGFLDVEREYAEAYVGPTFLPKPWIQIGAGVGLEQDSRPFRAGWFLWLGYSHYSFLFAGDHGGSGHWYKSELVLNLRKVFWVGPMTQKYAGTGVRVEIDIPNTRAKLWGAYLYDKDTKSYNKILSTRLTF